MTLLRRSEPPTERFPQETSSDAGRLEAARKVMEVIGTKRRRRLRTTNAVRIGTVFGFLAFFLLSILGRRSGPELQYAVAIFNAIGVVLSYLGAHYRASREQVDALRTLVPLAEKSDLPWLLEGTQYATTEGLYSSLLEKNKLLLATLEPDDGVYLPEGARKILRGWVWSTYHPEPETALLVLQALLRIKDPKMLADCARLARRKLHFPGDEQIQQLAARVAGTELQAVPAPINGLSIALEVITRRRKENRRGTIRDLILVSLIFITLGVGFLQFIQTNNGFWMLPAGLLFGYSLAVGVVSLIAREANSYTYRLALLALARFGHTPEHRKWLQEGLITIGSGGNRAVLEKAIERLQTEEGTA